MTCEKCGNKEVLRYEGDLTVTVSKFCPVCNDISFVSKEMSIKLLEREYEYIDKFLIDKIKRFNKSNLLFGLLVYREVLTSEFLVENPSINLNDLLSSILLLKKVMIHYKYPENMEVDIKEEDIEELFSYCNHLVDIKTNQFIIEEEFGYFSAKEYFNFINIEPSELSSKLDLFHNEDWLTVIESFDQIFIKTSEAAQDYLEEHKEEYNKNTYKMGSRVSTPEGYIHILYPTFQSFKFGLTKNRLFAETFEFEYMEDKKVLIESFSKLTEYSDLSCGKLTVLSVENFKRYLNDTFKELNQDKLYKDLVFKYDNQHVFPLFIELEDFTIKTTTHTVKCHSSIVTSLSFLNIIKLFYYPIYYKELYKAETDRLSNLFEKSIVPGEFYKMGFNVRVNIEKKNTLEIDSIAWNSNILYVVETKLWDINWYFEHRRAHIQRERDLKGIVDGYEYSYGRAERIPSLTSKIDYVKDNLTEILSKYAETQMFPDHDTTWNNCDKDIIGLIVTKSFPPIKNYKDIKMIGFKEIKDL